MESARHYDYILVNDKLRVAYEKLRAIVIAERCRAGRVFDAIREITEGRS
jgi:guanylate kinase